MQRVFTFFGGQVGYGATLQDALGQVVAGVAGLSQGPGGTGTGGVSGAVRGYLQQAERDYAQAQAALAARPTGWDTVRRSGK